MQLRIDDPGALDCLGNLPSSDDAVLEFEQFLARAGEVDRHDPNSCNAGARFSLVGRAVDKARAK